MDMEPNVLKFSKTGPGNRLADSEAELPSFILNQVYAHCILLLYSPFHGKRCHTKRGKIYITIVMKKTKETQIWNRIHKTQGNESATYLLIVKVMEITSKVTVAHQNAYSHASIHKHLRKRLKEKWASLGLYKLKNNFPLKKLSLNQILLLMWKVNTFLSTQIHQAF